jgi:hypothetical protein
MPHRVPYTYDLFHGARAPGGPGSTHYRGFTITLRHTTLGRTPLGELIRPSQKLLPDNTQHSQETDIHGRGGIRTHNPSKRGVQTHALDSATSGNDTLKVTESNNKGLSH